MFLFTCACVHLYTYINISYICICTSHISSLPVHTFSHIVGVTGQLSGHVKPSLLGYICRNSVHTQAVKNKSLTKAELHLQNITIMLTISIYIFL